MVTDGARVLLGHASRSPRWDIPKGVAELGEDFAAAAVRELEEETGLAASPQALRPLGVHAYLPRKDLALFEWRLSVLPDPAGLVCSTMVLRPGQPGFPEIDRFELFDWATALPKLGRNLARLLGALYAGGLASRR